MCMCLYACTYVYMCVQIHMCMCMLMLMYMDMDVGRHTAACVCVYAYVYVFVCMSICAGRCQSQGCGTRWRKRILDHMILRGTCRPPARETNLWEACVLGVTLRAVVRFQRSELGTRPQWGAVACVARAVVVGQVHAHTETARAERCEAVSALR